MSEQDFPSLVAPGQTPKLTSIFEVSAEFLGQLRLWFEMNPPRVPIDNVLGFPVQSRFLDRSATTADIANTAAETTLYSFEVGAGELSVDRMLRLTLVGDYLHNNAVGDALTFRVKFGGTTFMAFSFGGSFGNVVGANRQAWKAAVEIVNLNATNSQMMSLEGHAVRANQAAPTAGVGGIYDSINTGIAGGLAGISTPGTIDTTLAQTLTVTGQWSAASVNNSFRKRHGLLELV